MTAACHPRHVLHRLIKGETVRLWRTKKTAAALQHHLMIFMNCMASRGHPRHEVQRFIRQQLMKLKAGSVSKPSHSTRRAKFFALLPFSRAIPVRTIKKCFLKHAIGLQRAFNRDISAGPSFRVQTNLFRTHFQDNHWH